MEKNIIFLFCLRSVKLLMNWQKREFLELLKKNTKLETLIALIAKQ